MFSIKQISVGIVLGVCLLQPTGVYGQYWGENVLDKSFEHSDFFFTPNYLNPFGISTFGDAVYGLIDDPLLNVRLNPAFLATDTLAEHYAYLDFRSSKEIVTQNRYYPHDYAVRGGVSSYDIIDYRYYPSYYVDTRRPLEPVLSAAYLVRPFTGRLQPLRLGVSYQLLFQDERYYGIPTGIYRSNVGYDYGGERLADSGDIPIIDRYEGSDQMQQRGHLTTLMAGYSMLPSLHLGLRIGRTAYERAGTMGSTNLWDYIGDNNSAWFNREERTQDYDHWDVAAGLHYQPSKEILTGIHIGYLWGAVVQSLAQQDSSRYRNGTIGEGDNWSHYYQAGVDDQHWDHDGQTFFAGADLKAKLSPSRTLTAFYRHTRQNVDIALHSSIVDTSYNNYHSIWEDNTYSSQSHYALSDVRSGTGSQEDLSHHLGVTLQWQFDTKTRLSMGGHLIMQDRRTSTVEEVLASRNNYWSWQHEWTDQKDSRSDIRTTDEAKDLLWDFKTKQRGLRIPVYITRKFSDTVEFLFGFNRHILSWEITDVTLALFDFRNENYNGDITIEENFGERYTQPSERISDVQTSVLFGVTVTPSDRFNIRFLMVPNFSNSYGQTELQQLNWWISFTVIP